MMQQVIIAVLFVAALVYLGRIIYKSFQSKPGCSTGCGCGVDFNKLKSTFKKKTSNSL